MMTGVAAAAPDPRLHAVQSGDGRAGAITSDERLEKAVWEMAGDHGRDVAVLGMWATHPAEPVRGLMISERLFAILKNEQTPPGVGPPGR